MILKIGRQKYYLNEESPTVTGRIFSCRESTKFDLYKNL
jgi:hypothetical protein